MAEAALRRAGIVKKARKPEPAPEPAAPSQESSPHCAAADDGASSSHAEVSTQTALPAAEDVERAKTASRGCSGNEGERGDTGRFSKVKQHSKRRTAAPETAVTAPAADSASKDSAGARRQKADLVARIYPLDVLLRLRHQMLRRKRLHRVLRGRGRTFTMSVAQSEKGARLAAADTASLEGRSSGEDACSSATEEETEPSGDDADSGEETRLCLTAPRDRALPAEQPEHKQRSAPARQARHGYFEAAPAAEELPKGLIALGVRRAKGAGKGKKGGPAPSAPSDASARHYFAASNVLDSKTLPPPGDSAACSDGAEATSQPPNYVALDMQPHREVFWELARQFADELQAHFQIALPLPDARGSKHAAGGFRRPRLLHMTTAYVGGEAGALSASGIQRSLALIGTEWGVEVTHLLYAEGALLLAAVQVEAADKGSLPLEPGCFPHVTLLHRPPFSPGLARDVMAAAVSAGLVSSQVRREPTVLALPGLRLAGVSVDLFVQQLAPSTSSRNVAARAQRVVARLKTFAD
eukprot:TRINITY_DN13394_c0_g1_i8.p1 TRINITY_DN13394_c0_g1~~TRINITY_DN13394_c0_g1_i8.p1  ORF type:complete len:526 (-),score=92.80 TRINITY_DN13394_c0_g1_i8:35-1612(-)